MTILEQILGRKRVLVKENERAVALYKGEVTTSSARASTCLPNRADGWRSTATTSSNGVFVSVYEKALFAKLPRAAAKHLTVFRTGRNEVAVIERDGALHAVLAPDRKLVVWTDAGPWKVETVDLAAGVASSRRCCAG